MRPVAVSQPVVGSAVELAYRHGLRGYDAVHLASALAVPSARIVLVSWDEELRRAGAAEGLTTAPVGR